MSTNKITPIACATGKQRLIRYTITTVNAVALVGTIVFVTWILGRIVGALHTLVFSLAFAASPGQPQKDFPMLEDSLTKTEVHGTLEQSAATADRAALYSLDDSDWGQ